VLTGFYLPVLASSHVSPEMPHGHTLHHGTTGFIHKQKQPQEKSMNGKSYDRITERVVSLLSQGTVPWHKPWQVKTGLPRNLVSQKPYRGINVFLLMAMNYESPNWLTLRQANLLGGQIKPGEKSCPVVFWKPMNVQDKESGEDRKIPFLRLYHVFNVAQCTGLKHIPPADDTAFIQTLPAELVANMPQRPVIKHGMAMASYPRICGRIPGMHLAVAQADVWANDWWKSWAKSAGRRRRAKDL
jgi:hypothetical protein